MPELPNDEADIYLTDVDRLQMYWNKMDRAAMDAGWTLRKVIGKPPYKHVYLSGERDTRWWMYVQFENGVFNIWFDGQKLFQDENNENYWEDFEIEAGLELMPTDDFKAAIEGFALDEGPDEPTVAHESAQAIVARLLEADVPAEDDPDVWLPAKSAKVDMRKLLLDLRRRNWDVSHPWKENWEHAEDAVWVFTVYVDFPNAHEVLAKLRRDVTQLAPLSSKIKVGIERGAFRVRVPRANAFYSWRRGKMESKNI